MEQLLNFQNKNELIKIFLDNTPIAYIILDRNYRIHYINESFAKLRNLDIQEMIGNKCYNISNGGIPCSHCAVEKALRTKERALVCRKDTLPDESVRFIDDYAIPLQKDANGEIEFILEIMINRTQEMLAKEQGNQDYDEILSILTTLLDAKDTYTATHSDNVRRLSLNLARQLKLSPDQIFEISVAASLHDLGKVDIPTSIINKVGPLNDEEYNIIKSHPEYSFNILASFSSFDTIRHIARHHHERVDGKGYPDGLVSENISIGAKIVAVADTYDAITTTRSYRQALTHEYALEEIARVSGTQLDPEVVCAFLSMDFSCLVNELYSPVSNKQPQVERILQQETISNYAQQIDISPIDKEQLMLEIFKNTPCGYILMDKQRNVLFASDYFLEYMGLNAKDVLNKSCYEAGGIGAKPCANCAIERALLSKQTEYMRQEQFTANGKRIFDLFGVPLLESDGHVEYIIEIIIDRMAEVQLERQREQDFGQLIEMLEDLFERQKKNVDDTELSDQILLMRHRLNTLLTKKIK